MMKYEIYFTSACSHPSQKSIIAPQIILITDDVRPWRRARVATESKKISENVSMKLEALKQISSSFEVLFIVCVK